MNDRVEIKTGFVDNFDEYLKCSDVFLFPSKAEGLGTPLLESQVCGIPLVSNHIKNITDDVVQQNRGGYFLDLETKKWAKSIQEAIEIPEEVLVENAKYVSKMCSSNFIDDEYYYKN